MAAFKRVLFIDDDVITISINQRLMKLVNFAGEFISKKDGLEAIDYLTGDLTEMPDIIFVDLYMHAMDGWKFIEWFKKWSVDAGVNIPVYVLSSGLDTEFPAGDHSGVVNGYILKPVTAENLNNISEDFPE